MLCTAAESPGRLHKIWEIKRRAYKTAAPWAEPGLCDHKHSCKEQPQTPVWAGYCHERHNAPVTTSIYSYQNCVLSPKLRIYYFEPVGKATPHKAFWKTLDVNWRSTKFCQYLQLDKLKNYQYALSVEITLVNMQTQQKAKKPHLSVWCICKRNQKCTCSARTRTNLQVTASSYRIIQVTRCEKSVQGRHKFIQFRFTCHRTAQILHLPILHWSYCPFTDVKRMYLRRTTRKSAVCVSTSSLQR